MNNKDLIYDLFRYAGLQQQQQQHYSSSWSLFISMYMPFELDTLSNSRNFATWVVCLFHGFRLDSERTPIARNQKSINTNRRARVQAKLKRQRNRNTTRLGESKGNWHNIQPSSEHSTDRPSTH